MDEHGKKYKPEEVIPKVIKRISNGEAISTKEIVEEYKVSGSSFNKRLKDVREQFYEHYFEPDKSAGKWVRTEANFLNKMLLTPEETVILTGILRKQGEFGSELAPWVEKVVENYVKRTKTSVFKQDVLEKIDEDLEIIFAQIKYAIEEKRKIRFTFKDSNVVVYPYKIINLEYYWYLLGYEEYSEYWEKEGKNKYSKKVKTFTVTNIKNIEILTDTYNHDFTKTEDELKNAMNAFFSVNEDAKTIEIFVEDWLVEYIERAPYFSGWKNTKYEEKIDKKNYVLFEIKSTNKYYMDVIPTLLKYLPNIRIKNDEELVGKIFEHIEKFASAHNKGLIDRL